MPGIWPTLYLRVATSPDASGVFHANDEADESVGDIVDSIARHARMRPDVRHVPLAEARAKMGPYADALALDQRRAKPTRPRARLVAVAALGRWQRRASAGRVQDEARGGVEGSAPIALTVPSTIPSINPYSTALFASR